MRREGCRRSLRLLGQDRNRNIVLEGVVKDSNVLFVLFCFVDDVACADCGC